MMSPIFKKVNFLKKCPDANRSTHVNKQHKLREHKDVPWTLKHDMSLACTHHSVLTKRMPFYEHKLFLKRSYHIFWTRSHTPLKTVSFSGKMVHKLHLCIRRTLHMHITTTKMWTSGNRHLYWNPMVAASVDTRAGVFYSRATLLSFHSCRNVLLPDSRSAMHTQQRET